MFHEHLKGLCISLLLDGMFHIHIWSKMSFKATVSLLIFCFNDLSIDGNGLLKSPTIIVLLSIFSFMFVAFPLYI